MSGAVDAAKVRLRRARRRWPFLDHAIRTQEHYSRVNGGAQAGAVTYYAFLSFFPIVALAFFVVGYIARVYASARDNLVTAINSVFPTLIGQRPGQLHLSSMQNAATTVGVVGLVGLLYSGLGWLSGMRSALQVVFETPRDLAPAFLVGKLRDLVSLILIGLVLLLSVAVTGVAVGYSDRALDLVGVGSSTTWPVTLIGVVVGGAADLLLFYTLFRLLARPRIPRRALWQGALLGAVGFEVLKLISSYLLRATQQSPAVQAFGVALILLIWINYFSRVVMYAAAWAYTSTTASATEDAGPVPPPGLAPAPGSAVVPVPPDRPGSFDARVAFGAGAASALALVALVRRRRR